MTALPQTQQRTYPAQDRRRGSWPAGIYPAAPESSGATRGLARELPPAVDPSMVFGCVDWFLYPEVKAGAATGAGA